MKRKHQPVGKLKEGASKLVLEPTSEELGHVVTLMRQGCYSAAETLAKEIIERFPGHGFCWKIMGTSLLIQGRAGEALAPLQKAASLLPTDPDVHTNLGIILNDLGCLSEAEACYRRALEIRPDYAIGHNNLGNTLRNLGRLDEAEACFRHALNIKPDFAEALSSLGHVLDVLGRLDEAEACYRLVLEIRPDFAEIHSDLGHTLKKMGRLDDALAHYRVALKAKGDWKEALRRLTNPLVLLTGMTLDSPSATTSFAEAQKRTPASTDQEKLSTTTLPSPLPSDQEVDLPEGSLWFSRFRKLLGRSKLSQKHEDLHPIDSAGHPGPGSAKKLRIVLIYPPPWQIPSPGHAPLVGMPFGLPKDTNDRDLDGDFQTIPYGLLTIAAQARRDGHDISVYNLSTCPWQDVVTLIAETEADLYGISAFTANRRGMGAVAALIRQHHPQAHITVGGPFVTALPVDTLKYYRDIDTAVIGEGEETFMELLAYLGAVRPAVDIPGTAWREGEEVVVGPARPRINDLDALASPFDYFTAPIVMTSRGCPGKCSFCGSFTTWGRKVRFHSVESTLDILKKALARLPVPFISIKDDTFTSHRKRALAICDAIIENKMSFLWSCDTRVDCLDDELLGKMRLAGCQMISLGVESGSPEILKTMCKETTPEMVLNVTRAAQKYGMHVRYYMILINRGETDETIRQSNELIRAGRPNAYYFSALGFSPGTEDWSVLCEKQGLMPDIFFRNDFKELTVTANRHEDFQHVWLHAQCDIGIISGFDYTVEEREAIVERLPNLHSVHVELANAYFRSGRFDEARFELNRSEELGFPIGNIIHNQRACVSLARNNVGQALSLLERAGQSAPDRIVMGNYMKLKRWADTPVNGRGKIPVLSDSVLALDFTLESQAASLAAM